ncbi:Calmodulin-regulated spectrin-associated protein 2 [Clydaea vesicula]|uniref:Calmodulin-regulated spectrin-associated protein 2 n=1 Tax=Clydaea vesicula TaxID=447962 RepID=A0AAD5U6P2_9FUNG|nr:Calmodulin-regulated spectrin-associated protein 2 [Clydaea vesicula]
MEILKHTKALYLFYPQVDLLWFSSEEAVQASGAEVNEKNFLEIKKAIKHLELNDSIYDEDILESINGNLNTTVKILDAVKQKCNNSNLNKGDNFDSNYEIMDIHNIATNTIISSLCEGTLYEKATDIVLNELSEGKAEINNAKTKIKFLFLDKLVSKGFFKFKKKLSNSVKEMIGDTSPFYESIHSNIIEAIMAANQHVSMPLRIIEEELNLFDNRNKAICPFDYEDGILIWLNLIRCTFEEKPKEIDDIMKSLKDGKLFLFILQYYNKEPKVARKLEKFTDQSRFVNLNSSSKLKNIQLFLKYSKILNFTEPPFTAEEYCKGGVGFKKIILNYFLEFLKCVEKRHLQVKNGCTAEEVTKKIIVVSRKKLRQVEKLEYEDFSKKHIENCVLAPAAEENGFEKRSEVKKEFCVRLVSNQLTDENFEENNKDAAVFDEDYLANTKKNFSEDNARNVPNELISVSLKENSTKYSGLLENDSNSEKESKRVNMSVMPILSIPVAPDVNSSIKEVSSIECDVPSCSEDFQNNAEVNLSSSSSVETDSNMEILNLKPVVENKIPIQEKGAHNNEAVDKRTFSIVKEKSSTFEESVIDVVVKHDSFERLLHLELPPVESTLLNHSIDILSKKNIEFEDASSIIHSVDLSSCNVDNYQSEKIDANNGQLKKDDGEEVQLEKVDGDEVQLEKVDGDEVQLEKVDGDEVQLEKVDGDEVQLGKVDGNHVQLEKVEGGDVQLEKVDTDEVKISKTNFNKKDVCTTDEYSIIRENKKGIFNKKNEIVVECEISNTFSYKKKTDFTSHVGKKDSLDVTRSTFYGNDSQRVDASFTKLNHIISTDSISNEEVTEIESEVNSYIITDPTQLASKNIAGNELPCEEQSKIELNRKDEKQMSEKIHLNTEIILNDFEVIVGSETSCAGNSADKNSGFEIEGNTDIDSANTISEKLENRPELDSTRKIIPQKYVKISDICNPVGHIDKKEVFVESKNSRPSTANSLTYFVEFDKVNSIASKKNLPKRLRNQNKNSVVLPHLHPSVVPLAQSPPPSYHLSGVNLPSITDKKHSNMDSLEEKVDIGKSFFEDVVFTDPSLNKTKSNSIINEVSNHSKKLKRHAEKHGKISINPQAKNLLFNEFDVDENFSIYVPEGFQCKEFSDNAGYFGDEADELEYKIEGGANLEIFSNKIIPSEDHSKIFELLESRNSSHRKAFIIKTQELSENDLLKAAETTKKENSVELSKRLKLEKKAEFQNTLQHQKKLEIEKLEKLKTDQFYEIENEKRKKELEQKEKLQNKSKLREMKKLMEKESSDTQRKSLTGDSSKYKETKISLPVQKCKNLSNKKLIRNALIHVCLAGKVNENTLTEVLEDLDESKYENFIILFKGLKNNTFRGLYSYDSNLNQVLKTYTESQGPDSLTTDDVIEFYKYDSGSRTFKSIPTKSFGKNNKLL